ncbi:MAG: hypothetical protein ACREOI_00945 [bacterium]
MFNKFFRLTALMAACFFSTLPAQECETALEDAMESFAQQRYNQIIGLLTDCPPERLLEKTQKIVAYELLALAYFANSQADSAKAALNHLLDLQPGYSPQAPQYAEEFIKIVEEIKTARARREGRSIFRHKWLWLGGVAASSTAAFFIFKKKNRSCFRRRRIRRTFRKSLGHLAAPSFCLRRPSGHWPSASLGH